MAKCNFCSHDRRAVGNDKGYAICHECIRLAVRALKDKDMEKFRVINLESYKSYVMKKPEFPVA